MREAIRAAAGWVPAVDTYGDLRENAEVCEITGLFDASGWPEGTRFLVRRERPHPGALTIEVDDLNQRITKAINAHTPELLQRYGVGPDTAAALLLAAGGNPQRLTSEASFAALCGVSPIEMPSGKTQRRRLNRGGDRQANSALCMIVIARLR